VHERFVLRKLTVNDVVKDFEAINARVAPDGRDDPWTETTLEEKLVDLGWHQKEFELRRSFAYTVVAPDESRVLGCVYLYPSEADEVACGFGARRGTRDSIRCSRRRCGAGWRRDGRSARPSGPSGCAKFGSR
jgi:hypothetical protein